MALVLAEGTQLEAVLDDTYPLWNEGLTREAYGRWNAAQLRTPWGREHLHRYALVDERGQVLASAKRYRYDVRVDGREGWMLGIGAVFTPPTLRGRGYATELLRQLIEREQQAGALAAGLFSEISAAYYRRLGFEPLPREEVRLELVGKSGSPAMLVRSGTERDLSDLAAMHAIRSSSSRFALRRDPAQIHYAIAKKRLFSGVGRPGLRQTQFFVAEEGASAVAYVVITGTDEDWTIEEAGDRDPAGARLGGMLQVLVAREPSHRMPLIRAWWPSGFPVPPQARLTARGPARDLFMLRRLTAIEPPLRAEDVFYWRSDYF